MRLTFHISQMPNVICETNMKRDFIFSKNGLQEAQIATAPLPPIHPKTNSFPFALRPYGRSLSLAA